ncbi:MAG: HD domain-containing protein [Clostridia bacterium]
MNELLIKTENSLEFKDFYEIIEDIATNETVLEMKNYKQHYDTTTYEHCMHVAFLSYKIAKRLHLDVISLARASMLHDLFLYDWRKKQRHIELSGLHAFVHPKIALKNASALFTLNEKEKDIILKHMWPVTFALPKYKESFVITFVDKYCAVAESANYYISILNKKKIYRYAYVFLCLLGSFAVV